MNLIRVVFTPPQSAYTEENAIYKFGLAWKIFVFLSFFFSFIAFFHFANDNRNAYTTAIAALMSIGVLLSLKLTKRYEIAVYIVMILGSSINQYTLYTALNVERSVDLLWMICNASFVFYMVGYKIGIISLLVNVFGLIGSMFYVSNDTAIQTIQNNQFYHKVAHAINIIIAIAISSYFIKKIIDFSKENENKYKQVNETLKKQRDEKTIMLQEIHHRVKNNLQIISSLLRLQSRQFDDKHIIDQFQEAINRVSSMALIHEKMYQTEDISSIDIKNYLKSLISEISRTYTTGCHLTYNIQSNIKGFELNSLVPLALIFNELVTNSIKHAFTNKEKGKIDIVIDKKDNNTIAIIYKDNGVGFSQDKEENFGSILIETFTEQLNGNYTMKSTYGVCYEFVFNDLKTV